MKEWNPDELKESLDGGGKVFLKLWKKGCGPCKLSVPAVERLEKEYGQSMDFGQICIDDFPEMMDIADSEVLPAFFVFNSKKMVGKTIGFKGLAKLKELVESA